MKRKIDENNYTEETKKLKPHCDLGDTVSLLKQRFKEEENQTAGIILFFLT